RGDKHNPGSSVRYGYVRRSSAEQSAILLPLETEKGKLREREVLERFDGTLVPLPSAKPVKRGSHLAGAEIFRRNCALCHGDHGQGITGKPLKTIAGTRRTEIKKIVLNGRFSKAMPSWGKGVDELSGVLTGEEIDRVVEFIRSKLFRNGRAKGAN
ncbi:MAG: c-type cytochrome, partial [Nitrospinota bacterium]